MAALAGGDFGHQSSDRMNLSFGFCGIPSIRQEKGEWMGHGVGTKSSIQRPGSQKKLIPMRFPAVILKRCIVLTHYWISVSIHSWAILFRGPPMRRP